MRNLGFCNCVLGKVNNKVSSLQTSVKQIKHSGIFLMFLLFFLNWSLTFQNVKIKCYNLSQLTFQYDLCFFPNLLLCWKKKKNKSYRFFFSMDKDKNIKIRTFVRTDDSYRHKYTFWYFYVKNCNSVQSNMLILKCNEKRLARQPFVIFSDFYAKNK